MTIQAIRFANEGEFVKLQVLEFIAGEDAYTYKDNKAIWRDAKVQDLLVVARFTSDHEALQRKVQDLENNVCELMAQVHKLGQNALPVHNGSGLDAYQQNMNRF